MTEVSSDCLQTHLKNGGIMPQFLLTATCIWPIMAAIECSSLCSLLLNLSFSEAQYSSSPLSSALFLLSLLLLLLAELLSLVTDHSQ